ncbi:unnamed protein product [Closterium sp. NIES-53]
MRIWSSLYMCAAHTVLRQWQGMHRAMWKHERCYPISGNTCICHACLSALLPHHGTASRATPAAAAAHCCNPAASAMLQATPHACCCCSCCCKSANRIICLSVPPRYPPPISRSADHINDASLSRHCPPPMAQRAAKPNSSATLSASCCLTTASRAAAAIAAAAAASAHWDRNRLPAPRLVAPVLLPPGGGS